MNIVIKKEYKKKFLKYNNIVFDVLLFFYLVVHDVSWLFIRYPDVLHFFHLDKSRIKFYFWSSTCWKDEYYLIRLNFDNSEIKDKITMSIRKFSNINAYFVPKLLLWHIGFKVTTTFFAILQSSSSSIISISRGFILPLARILYFHDIHKVMLLNICYIVKNVLKITESLPICSRGFRSFLLSSWHLPIIKDVRKYLSIRQQNFYLKT